MINLTIGDIVSLEGNLFALFFLTIAFLMIVQLIIIFLIPKEVNIEAILIGCLVLLIFTSMFLVSINVNETLNYCKEHNMTRTDYTLEEKYAVECNNNIRFEYKKFIITNKWGNLDSKGEWVQK